MTSLKSQINAERSGTEAILKSREGDPLPLQRVEAKGVLKGLVLVMTLKQVYRNTSDENIECVYTFPLAWGATLTAMHVTLNGKCLSGQVIGKKKAEKKYEKAIAEGDTPVMLERSGKDLYTANLGNLLPDDEAVIEIEYAQLLKRGCPEFCVNGASVNSSASFHQIEW
jgi:Ca-activated chloride channel family protein